MTFEVGKYKKLYLIEAREHLESATKLLEKSRDRLSEEEMNTLFREAHSLKGMSAAMGYQSIADLAHAMENLMGEIRSGAKVFDDSNRDKLIMAGDSIWKAIEDVEADRPLPEMKEQINAMRSASPVRIPQREKAAAPVQQGVKRKVVIDIAFQKEMPSLSARAFLIYKNIENLGEILRSTPDLDEIKKGQFTGDLLIELETERLTDSIGSYLSKVKEITSFEIRDASGSTGPDGDSAATKADESRDQKPEDRSIVPQSIRVEVSLLDYFVNIIGELLTIKARIREATKESESIEISNVLNQMEILLKDVQGKVMQLRLMPLDVIFSRIRRWVRDIAKKLGKTVDVKIEGEGIELDRSVVEALVDPLLHIIRNAMDHGIEMPSERQAAGKAPRGTITVKARKEKDTVLVDIVDDGRGIDSTKVYEAALKSRKFSKEYLDGLKSRKDLLYLITYPGITTKTAVTDISGRGVGIDVVKSVLDSFGGSLEIDSELGKGTRISLSLPSSISIINILMFRVGSYCFGTPVDKITRILRVSRTELRNISENELAVFHEGEYVPLTYLAEKFGIESAASETELLPVIKLSVKGVNAAIAVDEFIGHKEVYLRPLNPPLSRIQGFYSSTMLGDGSPIIVLDLHNLV